MAEPVELIYRQLGLRVEQIRTMLGITQKELSDRIGLERASVANIEAGRQRIQMHTIEKIASVLGTTPKNLLKGIWT